MSCVPFEFGYISSVFFALAHKLARIVYVKKTEADYANEVRERLVKSLRRSAKELGFEMVK